HGACIRAFRCGVVHVGAADGQRRAEYHAEDQTHRTLLAAAVAEQWGNSRMACKGDMGPVCWVGGSSGNWGKSAAISSRRCRFGQYPWSPEAEPQGNAMMSVRITAAGAVAVVCLSFLTVPVSACD